MGVSGGSGVLRRFREAWNTWPPSRSTSARDGRGAVFFSSTDEVLTLVYRPHLSVRDVCTEAAVKVNISPVALDFFTLVSEDGCSYLNPEKILSEAECSQGYKFKLCIKACHGDELREIDKEAFEYYFYQCRQDFLRGKIGEFSTLNQNDFAKVVLFEIVYQARDKGVPAKVVIDNPRHYGIKRLLRSGIFERYDIKEVKQFLKDHVHMYENIRDDLIKSDYIRYLEKAEDFFVHKLSFEKIYTNENVNIQRKFEVLVSAEFGIKKRRTDVEKSLPEDIVKEFSEVEALEFDHMSNQVKISRTNSGPEILTASSSQSAYSLITLIQGYYRLKINQYKQLQRGTKRTGALLCHGPIMREKAENLLQKGSREDGAFLLRRRRNDHFSHAISVYYAKEVFHYVITQDTSVQPVTFHLQSDATKGFSSLSGLIEHYKQSADGLPVCLSKIYLPTTEGFAALLDRQILIPALPDFHLVDHFVKIPEADLQIAEPEMLSKGEFGEVRKGSWWCSNAEEMVLVASRALVKPFGREKIDEYRKAMSTFLELKNQHLTLFQGIAETSKALIFVFEFAAEGPLDLYIQKESKKGNGITKGRVVSYAAQIAEGMMFLHSQNCVHGRLSAHNVLVASEECVKISDFGLLHLVEHKQSFFHASRKGYGYSYCWFAPLSLQQHRFDFASDVWSFGVTLWEMFVMKRPFHCNFSGQVLTEEEVMSQYLKGQYLDPDRPNVPSKVGELIKRCFAPEPQDRMPFQDLVIKLRSPGLVPEKEADKVLLPPDINKLEDWEPPMLPEQTELELQKRRADSQVSNVDYSYLPGNELPDNSGINDDTLKLASTTPMPSNSHFKNTVLRKQSLSKTFSHPGLAYYSFSADSTPPSTKPVNGLAPRKPSITRVSSCPPAIEATSTEPQDRSRTTEPVERQEEVRYVQSPISFSRDSYQARNADVKLPFPSMPTQLAPHVTGADNAVDASSEELDDSGDSSSAGDDYERHSTEFCAEALAMMSLGGLVSGSVMPPSSSADVVCRCVEDYNLEESNEQLRDCGSSGNVSLNTTMSLVGPMSGPVIPSSGSADDVNHSDGESNEQLSKYGSSAYVKFKTTTPASSGSQSSPMANPTEEESRKMSSGSYVTLSVPPRSSMPPDQLEGIEDVQHPPMVHNTADDSLAFAVSPQRPLDSQNIEQQTSPYQSHSQLKNTSPEFHCKSSDELLASFSNCSQQNGMGSVDHDLAEFLSDGEDNSGREESSPVISDLQDDSEGDDSDSSSRDDAETSLGRMFHSGFNRILKDDNVESDSAVDPPIFALSSCIGFDLNTSAQPQLLLEDDSLSHNDDNVERDGALDPPTHTLSSCIEFDLNTSAQPQSLLEDESHSLHVSEPTHMDNTKLFMGFLSEEDNHDHEHARESQEVFISPRFDHDAFLSNIASVTSPIVPGLDCSPSDVMNTTDTKEDNEHEKGEDDNTIDDELGLSCGSMGNSPGKVNFLNSPILMFDEGHENFEMKEFSLNNLSKDCPKSTELLFFKDNQPVRQEMNSNQLNEELSEDGCSQDDEHEADDVIEENVLANPSPYSLKADVDGHLQAITKAAPQRPVGGGYIRKEQQLVNNGSVANGYRPTPEPVEQEPGASISRSSSIDGIWPSCDTTDDFVKRKSTIGSCSSWGDEQATIQLDMNKIPPKLLIQHEQLHLQGFLGQGYFGEVRRATMVYTDCLKNPKREDVAVKVLKANASQQSSSDFVKEVQNMVELASKQECTYIIKLRGVCKDPQEKLMLVTELAPLGALSHYLPKNKEILGTKELLRFCMQICKGMRYLEKQSLLHRDLAARNILVEREDLVKISDFGLSRLQDYYKVQDTQARVLPVKWYALESLLEGRFITKSDVWSFGVTMWEIFSYGRTPYEKMEMEPMKLTKFLEDGNRLLCPDKCPPKVFEVMQNCWLADPIKRPSFYLLDINDLASCCPNGDYS